jgi:hypothetical protein
VAGLVRGLEDVQDPDTAAVLDGILADEVQHVRFANRWLQRLAREDPRVLMAIASAVRFLAAANASLQSRAGDVNPVGKVLEDPSSRVPTVNVEDRRRAEFSEEEIHEVLRQAGFRSLTDPGPRA